MLEIDRGFYEVTFIPTEAAKHKIYVYFNGHEVKGEKRVKDVQFPLWMRGKENGTVANCISDHYDDVYFFVFPSKMSYLNTLEPI